MKIVLLLFFAAFAQANLLNDDKNVRVTNKTQGIQPASYVNLGGHYYYFSPPTSRQTVFEAMEFCNFDGMSLVSIETMEENTLIADYMTAAGLNDEVYWTSGQKFQGFWQWSGSGQLFSYTAWYTNQPSGTESTACVFINSGKWYDYFCTQSHSFICE